MNTNYMKFDGSKKREEKKPYVENQGCNKSTTHILEFGPIIAVFPIEKVNNVKQSFVLCAIILNR